MNKMSEHVRKIGAFAVKIKTYPGLSASIADANCMYGIITDEFSVDDSFDGQEVVSSQDSPFDTHFNW